MKNYAIENEMLKHPQRMLISSFKLEKGTVITPLFNFYLELGFQCNKVYRFVQYTQWNWSNNFCSTSGWCEKKRRWKPFIRRCSRNNKLLCNSSYGYQIKDKSRHTITKYLNEEKIHKAISEPLFKRLNAVENDLFEVELLNLTIEHRELILVGFFIPQYAKQRMIEL